MPKFHKTVEFVNTVKNVKNAEIALTGTFSDRSPEREEYDAEIEKKFGGKGHELVEMNAQDGTFFMR